MRIFESSISCKSKNKGILVVRTLVDVSDNNPMLTRVVSLSTEPQTLGVETVVAVAQPIKEVTTLKTTQSYLEDPSPESPPTSETEPGNQLPEPLHELWTRNREHVNEEENSQVAALLLKYQHVFLLSDSDLDKTKLVEHEINTGDALPVRQHPRHTSPWRQTEIKQQLSDLLERGVIEESSSPWASPVVLVTKKDGTKRFCVDYR